MKKPVTETRSIIIRGRVRPSVWATLSNWYRSQGVYPRNQGDLMHLIVEDFCDLITTHTPQVLIPPDDPRVRGLIEGLGEKGKWERKERVKEISNAHVTFTPPPANPFISVDEEIARVAKEWLRQTATDRQGQEDDTHQA